MRFGEYRTDSHKRFCPVHGPPEPWRATERNAGDECETLSMVAGGECCMSSNDGSGLMSSAGLVRYFDSEGEKGPTMDPKTVIAFSTLLGIFVLLLNAFA